MQAHECGLPAFNTNNMEQGLAIMEAAERLPIARSLSKRAGFTLLRQRHHARKDHGGAGAYLPGHPDLQHQDVATCLSAVQHGYTSVMMDGALKEDAKTPAALS